LRRSKGRAFCCLFEKLFFCVFLFCGYDLKRRTTCSVTITHNLVILHILAFASSFHNKQQYLVCIFRCSSSPCSPVYVRRIDSSKRQKCQFIHNKRMWFLSRWVWDWGSWEWVGRHTYHIWNSLSNRYRYSKSYFRSSLKLESDSSRESSCSKCDRPNPEYTLLDTSDLVRLRWPWLEKKFWSTFQCYTVSPYWWHCGGTHWSSSVCFDLVMYWSQTSDIRLCSRMQKTPVLFPTGGWTTIPSGHIRQNLFLATTSFGWPSWIFLSSTCVRGHFISRSFAVFRIVSCVRLRYCSPSISDGISFHNVWRHFSPEMYKNFHSGSDSRSSSPWISRHHWWWASMWVADKVSHVCWIWPKVCSGRSFSVLNRSSDVSIRGCYTCPLRNVSCCLEKSSEMCLTSFFAIEEHYFSIVTGVTAAMLRPSDMFLENALQLHDSSKVWRCTHPPTHRHVLLWYFPHRTHPFSVDKEFVTKMMTHRVLRTVCLIWLNPCS
jgi:hypothetical protein